MAFIDRIWVRFLNWFYSHTSSMQGNRFRCRLHGHMWYFNHWDEAREGVAILKCLRCWPHKDGIIAVGAYDFKREVGR